MMYKELNTVQSVDLDRMLEIMGGWTNGSGEERGVCLALEKAPSNTPLDVIAEDIVAGSPQQIGADIKARR